MLKYTFSTTKERKIAKELYDEGFSCFFISKKINRGYSIIRKWRDEEEWSKREKDVKKKELAKKLVNKFKIYEVAKKIDVSTETLRRWGIYKNESKKK